VISATRLDLISISFQFRRHHEWERPSFDPALRKRPRKEPLMNRALLAELQSQRSYPSVTVLFNSTPSPQLDGGQHGVTRALFEEADRRLKGDVADFVRSGLLTTLRELAVQAESANGSKAIALCVSPDYSAVVHLGTAVTERVVIDETFATRDLVADLNRTALYRVVAVSDNSARLFLGDRQRLVEDGNSEWPMMRADEQSSASWRKQVVDALQAEHKNHALPTVIAGAARYVRHLVNAAHVPTVGFVPGNHDRTSWRHLHHLVWPLIADWMRTDTTRALQQLEDARSKCRYAGGLDEVWTLANEGRVALLVVEENFVVAARINGNHLDRNVDPIAPDVVDDVIDEVIEVVLKHDGSVVIVADETLAQHEQIAAVLRF
jgi:Bacterial archaeo-eukaryotic release factor family 3